MNLELVGGLVDEFCKSTHGSTDYFKDEIFVAETGLQKLAPFSFLRKKIEGLKDIKQLLEFGYCFASFEYPERPEFRQWYETQFSRKLTPKHLKVIQILHRPNVFEVAKVLEEIDRAYQVLRDQDILLNSKNLPVQLGEWYAKSIFGLRQIKSSSQRGFDFYLPNLSRAEVKIHWKEQSSPKGVKIKKSLADLSKFCIIVYLSKNFLIRDICLLDSDFVIRKFAGKGHTIFLKDPDLAPYFFSKSDKHYDKIIDKTAMMKFASPTFALRLNDKLIL